MFQKTTRRLGRAAACGQTRSSGNGKAKFLESDILLTLCVQRPTCGSESSQSVHSSCACVGSGTGNINSWFLLPQSSEDKGTQHTDLAADLSKDAALIQPTARINSTLLPHVPVSCTCRFNRTNKTDVYCWKSAPGAGNKWHFTEGTHHVGSTPAGMGLVFRT